MSLLFQHPALLGLLALGALPVLVHLLSRARPPVYRFSNLDFLRRVMRRTTRIRRPKDRLLLALRTLALLALAAAFAAPVLVSESAAPPGTKSTVILLIDRSASMAAREGVGSRFDAACAEAARFLEEARPDFANLVWIDAVPDAVFPEPGPNTAFLGDLLKQAKPHPEAGALDAAFDLALRQLTQATGRRQLVVISDFQASAWRNFQRTLPRDVIVHTQRVATTSPPNVAVTRLIPQPAQPVAGQELTLLARVRNFSAEPVRTRLTVDADGARQSPAVDLPPWGEAEAAAIFRPAKAGPLAISASVEADPFPGDDARHAVVHVRDSLRLAIDGPPESPEARLLDKLASALDWLDIAQENQTGAQPDIRFVTAWTGNDPQSLRREATAGTTVIVRPTAACPGAAVRQLLDLPADPTASPLALDAAAATPWSVIPAENHPANELFRSGDFGNPFAGTFRERLRLPADWAAEKSIRPVALYQDGVPALIESPSSNGAPVLLWNLPLDPARTDWPLQSPFLPAIAEILLRTRPRAASEPTFLLPGSPIGWSSNDPAHVGAVTLTGPDGNPLETNESTTAEGTLWQSTQPATPGLHRWRISGQDIAFTAVNFPESESDLRPLDSAPAFGAARASSDSLARQAALAHGIPLWPYLVLAALLGLAVESLIHWRSAKPLTAS